MLLAASATVLVTFSASRWTTVLTIILAFCATPW